ncbi:ABC transporter ATP-binding protein [Devriesea agamarum]|uniref:ABC transporter ATP-binding protein n=1 Tax=Devriesea agamarum TaxID=472569 RepID=UPI00071CDB76|nr:ABC transporter ATP-binding protein [Devriesea agamarum]
MTESAGQVMFRTEDLSWCVDGKTIVDGITIQIPRDQMTMIIGLNGSGKTTLLHLLAGLRTPTTGTVWVHDKKLAQIPRRQRARIMALLEQVPRATVDLEVRDVVALGRIPHRGRWGHIREDGAVDRSMRMTGIADLASRRWSHLSGGEKQRVQLARALAQEPQALLLDEPTNHLDLRHQIDLLSQVREVGLTTVAVIHDLDLAAAFADYLLVMNAGHVVAAGPVQEILTDELVRQHFQVNGTVEATDRLRFSWSSLA